MILYLVIYKARNEEVKMVSLSSTTLNARLRNKNKFGWWSKDGEDFKFLASIPRHMNEFPDNTMLIWRDGVVIPESQFMVPEE